MKKILNILLTLVILMGVSLNIQAQDLNDIDTAEVKIDVQTDSTYNLTMKYFVKSEVMLNKKHSTWVIYKGYTKSKYFWLGTGSLAIASGFYIAAAWSDPIIYIESHKYYTRDYYNKSVTKRNIKIIGGAAFTGLAVYLYSRMTKKRRVRWIVGPDGVKYTF